MTASANNTVADIDGPDASSSSVLVLYKVSNSKVDSSCNYYNAFQIPKQQFADSTLSTTSRHGKAMTLSHVKQHMTPLFQSMGEEEGSNNYHWRVLVNNSSEDIRSSGWCDANRENDYLPLQSCSADELESLLTGNNSASASDKTAPRLDVLVLKLLDLTQLRLEQMQKKMLKQKLKKMKKKFNVATTRSADGPSLLTLPPPPSARVFISETNEEEDGIEAVLSLDLYPEDEVDEEEKKEEELLRIEDHPLAFACKPTMRESVLSSSSSPSSRSSALSMDDKALIVEENVSTVVTRNVEEHPLAFACKPKMRESVLLSSNTNNESSAEEAIEAILTQIPSEEFLVNPSGSSIDKVETKEMTSRSISNNVAAKTSIVSKAQNEFECVLTRSPQPTQPKASEKKPPSSPNSRHKLHQHSKKTTTTKTTVHKNHNPHHHKITVRRTSPTASPTNTMRYHHHHHHRSTTTQQVTTKTTSARSFSPQSVADFGNSVSPAPTQSPETTRTNTNQTRQLHHSELYMPDFNMHDAYPSLSKRSTSWKPELTKTPVVSVTPPMPLPKATSAVMTTTTTGLLSSAPPALRLHPGWEDTIGLSTAAVAPARQQSPPAPRKLSWEEAIQGPSDTATAAAVPPPMEYHHHNHQQQVPAPFIPSSHCMV